MMFPLKKKLGYMKYELEGGAIFYFKHYVWRKSIQAWKHLPHGKQNPIPSIILTPPPILKNWSLKFDKSNLNGDKWI